MTSGIEFEKAGVKLSSSYTIAASYTAKTAKYVESSVKKWKKTTRKENCALEWTPGQMASLW